MWDETVANMQVIWVSKKTNYFFDEDWTGSISLILLNKSGRRRTPLLQASELRLFVHAGYRGDLVRDSALAAPFGRTLTKGLSEEPA